MKDNQSNTDHTDTNQAHISLAAKWLQLQAQFALRWQNQSETKEKPPGIMSMLMMQAEASPPGLSAWQKILAAQVPPSHAAPRFSNSPFPVLNLPNSYASNLKATGTARWPPPR